MRAVGTVLSGVLALAACARAAEPPATMRPPVLTAADAALLEDVQRCAVLFFAEQSDARTGLTLDRASVDGTRARTGVPSSVAATGFALTAWCIADARGWMAPSETRRRVAETLRFVEAHHAHERGWFYHFVDAATGERAWQSEASTIDTALFLQGALMAREYLRDQEISELVARIYERVDWRWALNGGRTVAHGWRPENGFIPHRWDSYAEMLGLYLLGIGAPVHALPAESWQAWRREPQVTMGNRSYLGSGPLFTHQYAHAWFDFRQKRDAQTDYWQNSIDATLAQRDWCAAQASRFSQWSADLWGLTSADGPRGYTAWSTPPTTRAADDFSDGTLVPCAPGGSLPFAPRECLASLRRMREVGGARVWGRYGFVDAFNPQTGWASPDVVAINTGITLVMAENLRSGLVWRTFMRAPEVQRGLRLAGLVPRTSHEGPAILATVVR